jgi:hypothetical protein
MREEWIIAQSIANAAVIANTIDCEHEGEEEYSPEARRRVAQEVAKRVSRFQVDSLQYMLKLVQDQRD